MSRAWGVRAFFFFEFSKIPYKVFVVVVIKLTQEKCGARRRGKKKRKKRRCRSPNVSLTPTLPPLNADTQRIELSCIYRKLLKTI